MGKIARLSLRRSANQPRAPRLIRFLTGGLDMSLDSTLTATPEFEAARPGKGWLRR